MIGFCGFLCCCGCGQECACDSGLIATRQQHLDTAGLCLGAEHPPPGRVTEAGHVLPGPVLCGVDGCVLALGHHGRCLGVQQCQAILDGYGASEEAA